LALSIKYSIPFQTETTAAVAATKTAHPKRSGPNAEAPKTPAARFTSTAAALN